MNTAVEFLSMITDLRGSGLKLREIAAESGTSLDVIRNANRIKTGPSTQAFEAVARLHRRRIKGGKFPEHKLGSDRFANGVQPRYRR
ncbi:hypothetical protein GOB36_15370 [Sinorhizobium meliloti]|uniref:hypothetical protein n=1 Tax=Rhizobium meliloti TaxID=382 RepID=UPI00299F19AF|nr:hypothetical protein [Sinorhizobium meliloti]MDX0033058.1 hypothetical protein [Sinorhizobium meliloti]